LGDPWRVFRLTLQYDGTAYSGFQRHRLESPPSIQSTVEAALARLVNHPVAIQAAGRTDAGVHATGQVVSLATRAQRSVQTLVRGANALLPDDIRVLEAA